MTCKDCLYYDFCNDYNEYPDYIQHCEQTMGTEFKCSHFKDKSSFIELPCRAGETLYRIVGNEGIGFSILQATAWRVELDANDFTKVKRFVILMDSSYTEKDVDIDEFGKTIFRSLDDAEKECAEMRRKAIAKMREKALAERREK